jgi:hypothetical protein
MIPEGWRKKNWEDFKKQNPKDYLKKLHSGNINYDNTAKLLGVPLRGNETFTELLQIERNKMAQQNEEHFETIDKNKAKSYEDQKQMRQELIEWVKTCDKLHMGELYSEMRRMKRSWND